MKKILVIGLIGAAKTPQRHGLDEFFKFLCIGDLDIFLYLGVTLDDMQIDLGKKSSLIG
jgi:hypothetical protein